VSIPLVVDGAVDVSGGIERPSVLTPASWLALELLVVCVESTAVTSLFNPRLECPISNLT
jgi:hypothetical protein